MVEARDQSIPEKKKTTNVEIILVRDQYPPTIAYPQYNEEITENVAVNTTTVSRIIATDRDLKVRNQVTLNYIFPTILAADFDQNISLIIISYWQGTFDPHYCHWFQQRLLNSHQSGAINISNLNIRIGSVF